MQGLSTFLVVYHTCARASRNREHWIKDQVLESKSIDVKYDILCKTVSHRVVHKYGFIHASEEN